ncbi:hypothetical protein QAD02_020953 [Eretmocerus hayati]|uniref:Uncharacterized protein n=1 Tax=Eretmocerus hayati TaxID=131215 RepID=A0ACC2PP28_9HYME|nr:hypothetical protein QAD02_020953 [Eretmocerus hayati]
MSNYSTNTDKSSMPASPVQSPSPKNVQLVLRSLGPGWEGWEIVRHPTTMNVEGGICKDCKQYYQKPDLARRTKHKERCLKALAEKVDDACDSEYDNESVALESSPASMPKKAADCTPSKQPKKRCSNEIQRFDNPATRAKVDVALAKLMLRFNIGFENASSKLLKGFCELLDPLYTIPTQDDFEKKVLPQVVEYSLKSNLSNDMSNVVLVQYLELEESKKQSLVSVILTKANGQVLIDANVYDCVTEEDFCCFCKKSAKIILDIYDVDVRYLIHNTCFKFVAFRNEAKTSVTYCLNGFNELLDDLELNHDPFMVTSSTRDLPTKYYEDLRNLRGVVSKPCTTDVATKLFVELADNPLYSSNKSVKSKKVQFLGPIQYAAMFLNPEYHSKYLTRESSLKVMIFINDIMQQDCDKMELVGHYKDETNNFLNLFEDHSNDAKKFWGLAAVFCPDLSKLAMRLLNLPAIPNIKCVEAISKECMNSPIAGGDMKALKLSMMLEDCL